jgi:stage II sporulation protein M
VVLAILIFIGSILLGYSDYENVMTLAKAVFGEMAKGITTFNLITRIRLMLMIFLRNLSVTSLMVITGPFLALASFLIISFNGYMIGGVFRYSLANRGLIKSIMLILPHGVVEIPTFFYATYISIELAIQFIKNKEELADYYKENLRKILTRIIPLLLLAAFIETFITPYVASIV